VLFANVSRVRAVINTLHSYLILVCYYFPITSGRIVKPKNLDPVSKKFSRHASYMASLKF